MILRTERKHDFRQPSSWRRLLAFLCAFVLLISVSGVTAFAKNDNTIYSDPVRVPIRPTEEPQPDVETEETPLLDETAELPEETPEPDTADKETTADEIADDNQTEDIHDADETKDDTDQSPVTDEVTEEETSEEENAEQTENIIEENDSVGAETEEPEEDTEPGIIYPAGTLNAELEGCTVSINYTSEACIPENAALSINEAKGMDLYSALKAASKLIRNEEDEIWGKQVSEEGNCFYQLTITDAEGNEIRPKAWVNLICELNDAPEGVTYFLTGENARILDEQHNSVYVTDYAMEPFGYAVVNKVQIGTVIQEYSASDYVVTASYGPEAGFPSNTEMKVREIQPGTPEYALYSGMTEEALGEDWSEITLERYFDITFISGSEELEPQADVDVQIVFKDVIELTEEHDIQAVHFENKEAVVIESETDSNDEEAKRSGEVIDTISFASDSFSVFGVVQRTKITQKVLAADGNTYEINVTYGPEAGIPGNAELLVEEIPEGSDLWEAYRKQTAAALGADDVRLPGLYDISIFVDRQKIEPQVPVNVSVRLANAEAGEELHVVHFKEVLPDELVVPVEKQTEIQPLAAEDRISSENITDAVVEGNTVTFDTDGFSVYAFAYTVVVYYRTASGDNYRITLDYDAGAGIPAGAELRVEELLPGDARYAEYLERAFRRVMETEDGEETDEISIPEDLYARFFDIEILSGGQKIEPTGKVSVTFELTDAPEDRQDELKVLHFTRENIDILDAEISTDAGILFETDAFSVYGVITYATAQPQGVDDLGGRSFLVRHNNMFMTSDINSPGSGVSNYFTKTQNWYEAATWYFEETAEPGKYHVFTIKDGARKYLILERRSNTQGNVTLQDAPKEPFAVTKNSDGTYSLLMKSVNNPAANTEYYLNDTYSYGFSGYHEDSPSANSRLELTFWDSPAVQNGKSYMTLVKYGGKYYIVNNDASLKEVEYDPETNKVKVDNPMLWTVEGDNPNKHIYFNTEATGYDSVQLAAGFYRRYLDPDEPGAFTEEKSGDIVLDNEYHVVNRDEMLAGTALSYDNGHLYRGSWTDSNHLGIVTDANGTPIKLVGGQTAENGAEFIFADATQVSEVSDRNHTVNHIDISISSASKVNVPLAYGTYYYQDPDTGEWQEYVVNTNTSLALSEKVVIDSEDMKHATIKAYDKNHNELDNAFAITGFSSNAEYGDSSVQVRVEGSFKVSNGVNPYDGEDANSDRVKADRLANPITYVISVVKNLDFNMVDPTRGQLYEKVGDSYVPLKVNVDVDMTASFNYFDPENECPPLQTGWDGGYNNWLWSTGGIPGGSGMDFALGGDGNEDNPNVVALEFTKMIVDEQGGYIHPAEKIVNSIAVYGNIGKNTDPQAANSVSGVNVGEYSGDTVDYSGYKLLHSKDVSVGTSGTGLIYDYAVSPGMYYIAEDKDKITDSFTDTDGNVWNYKETYIITEYVNRGDSYSGSHQLHYSDTYTKENGSYVSIPEVVGPFTNMANQSDRSTFLEFYVYNIYTMDDTSLDAEKQWAEDTAVPENAEVTLDLYYAKRQITDNGAQLGTIADWPMYDDYLVAEGDPIFRDQTDTKLTLTAADSWQGTFSNLPRTWKDNDGNDWELDYYARETAITLNGENIIDRYIQEIVKDEPASSNAASSDGKVTVTNTGKKTSLTVKKEWHPEGEDSHYENDSITLRLVRYKKDAPLRQGILNITHIASGLSSTELPDGFEAVYTYQGQNGSGTFTSTGEHSVLEGTYTVAVTVTNNAAPTGYKYTSTTEEVTVTVPAGGSAEAAFTSNYSRKTGTLNITHISSGISGTNALPSGVGVSYTYTGADGSGSFTSAGEHTVPVGTYTVTANVTEGAAPEGYEYDSTDGSFEVTVPENGTGTVTFTSTYIADSGVLTIRKAGLPTGASGFAATYTVTGPNNYNRTIYYSQFSNNEYSLSGLKAGTYTVVEEVTGEVEGYTRTSSEETSQQASVANETTRTITFTGEYEQATPVEYATVMVYVTYYLQPYIHDSNVGIKLSVPKNSTVYFSCSTFAFSNYSASPRIKLQYFDNSNQYDPKWRDVNGAFNAPVTNRPIIIGDRDEYCIIVEMHEEDAGRGTMNLTRSSSGSLRNRIKGILGFKASAGVTSGSFRSRSSGLPDDYGLDQGYEGETVILTSADSWEQLVESLDIYDENGEPYYYAVEETNQAGYTVSYSPKYVNAEQTEGTIITITNTLIEASETVHDTVTVYKTDGSVPLAGATFTLSDADGECIKQYIMNGLTSFEIDTGDPDLAEILPSPGESVNLTLKETVPPQNHWGSNVQYTVTISASEDSTWNTDHTAWTTTTTYEISIDGQDSVTIANTPIRSIKVIKNVEENGEASETLNGKKIRIGLFKSPEEPTGETPVETGNIAELNISGNTSGEVELFTGLTAGTYWVYEVDQNGYPVKNGSAIIINGNTFTVEQSTAKATLMNAGDMVTISITNNKEGVGGLTVTKIIAGDDADYDKEFEFTVTQTNEPQIPNGTYGGMIFENGRSVFTLGNGDSCTASNLPYGFTYTVTETEADTDNYITGVTCETNLEDPQEADGFIKTGETETVTVTNTKTLLKSIRVTKEWMGVLPEDTANCPAVTFALYQAVHNGWGNAEIYTDDTGFDYSMIRLDYQNDWTWNCPVELPETDDNGREYRYFVIETPVTPKHNGTDEIIKTIPLLIDYPIKIDGYQCRQIVDTGSWSDKEQYQQPFKAHIGNHGEIKILNKAPGYLQMSIKKKFWTVDSDGSTWTTTMDMKGLFLEWQLYRRAVEDKPSEYEVITDWAEYGSSFIVGYEEDGTPKHTNSNPFTIENQGNDWNWRIWDTNQNQGLPSHGFVWNEDESMTAVRYQYIVKELNAYKDVNGTIPYSDYTWTAILPAAWEKLDFNGNNPHLVQLFDRAPLSGLDEMANIASTELSVEKKWDRHSSVKEVYVKIYRTGSIQNYDANQVEDFTAILGTGGHVLDGFTGASNSGTLSDSSALKEIEGLGYVLALKDGDNIRISDILTINETGQSQYSYWVEEVGYADRDGTILVDVDQFDPQYTTIGHEVTLNNVNGRIKSPVITLGSIGSNKFTISNTSTDPNETEIRVRKTTTEDVFLLGAKFKLIRVKDVVGTAYAQDEEGAWQSGEQAVEMTEGTVFDGLQVGFYQLVETDVPPGYLPLSEKIILEVSEQDGELVVTDQSTTAEMHTFTIEDGEYVFTVKNKAGLPLPTTGGSGTLTYIIGGLMMILLASVLFVYRKRKKYQ